MAQRHDLVGLPRGPAGRLSHTSACGTGRSAGSPAGKCFAIFFLEARHQPRTRGSEDGFAETSAAAEPQVPAGYREMERLWAEKTQGPGPP